MLTRHHQRKQASPGWTYREILEIVALPPPEGLHHWHTKVSQLASDLGMPSGATGRDIVSFVLRVASMKNELHRVTPLVKALAAAARVIEGRIVAPTTLLPVVLAIYPSAGPLCSMAAVGAESNTAWKRYHDEVESSLARELIVHADASEVASGSVFGEEEENVKECNDGDHHDNDSDAVAEAEAETEVGDATFQRPPSYPEEDLYCRVGDCLWAFKNPWTCIKHRLTHFSVRWVCPGPCQLEVSEESPATSKFASADSLWCHLLNNAACVNAVLEALNMQDSELPESGTAFLAPFCNVPERRWEDRDYQLTDLKSVKEAKMKLGNSGCAA